LVLRGALTETDPSAVQRTLGQAWTATVRYLPADARASATENFERGLARLLRDAEAGSDTQLTVVRQLATAARSDAAAELLAAWLAGEEVPPGLTVDTDLRWHLVTALARLGRADESAIEAELAADNTITGRQHAAAARAARPTAEAKAEAWRAAVEDPQVPNETQRSICLAFQQPGQEEVLRPYTNSFFEVAEAISAGRDGWPERGTARRDNVLDYLFPTDATRELVSRVEHWMSTTELAPAVRRSISESQDDLLRSLNAQAAFTAGAESPADETGSPAEESGDAPAEAERAEPNQVAEDDWPTTEQPIVRD